VLRISFAEAVAHSVVAPQINEWLNENFQLVDFAIRFTRTLRAASARASKALQPLYLGEGHYQKIRCVVPDGASTKDISPFINPHESASQLRREAAGRLLKRVVTPMLAPGTSVHTSENNGILLRQWQPICRFEWEDVDGETPIEFEAEKMSSLGLQAAPIAKACVEQYRNRPRRQTQWV
jgi:hypothetical protein